MQALYSIPTQRTRPPLDQFPGGTLGQTPHQGFHAGTAMGHTTLRTLKLGNTYIVTGSTRWLRRYPPPPSRFDLSSPTFIHATSDLDLAQIELACPRQPQAYLSRPRHNVNEFHSCQQKHIETLRRNRKKHCFSMPWLRFLSRGGGAQFIHGDPLLIRPFSGRAEIDRCICVACVYILACNTPGRILAAHLIIRLHLPSSSRLLVRASSNSHQTNRHRQLRISTSKLKPRTAHTQKPLQAARVRASGDFQP
jgi:hypothetical protein